MLSSTLIILFPAQLPQIYAPDSGDCDAAASVAGSCATRKGSLYPNGTYCSAWILDVALPVNLSQILSSSSWGLL
jgi:hypothetical protein